MDFSKQSSLRARQINTDVPLRFGFILLSTFLLFSIQSSRVNAAQYCYTCLAMDCPGDHIECEAVRDFVVGHLRSLYDFETYLPVCKPVNDTLGWRLQQYDEPPCRDTSQYGTCTAGRIQVKSNRGLEKPQFISHATILGCANLDLLASIKRSVTENRCDMIKTTGTTNEKYELRHDLQLEHCSRPETVCHGTDFCVTHEQSVIKEFKNINRSLARFDVGLVLGIVAFIIVVFAAIVGASLCSFPLNRPSNLPKSSPDDTDLVAVRSSKSDDSIHKPPCPEDEMQSLNG